MSLILNQIYKIIKAIHNTQPDENRKTGTLGRQEHAGFWESSSIITNAIMVHNKRKAQLSSSTGGFVLLWPIYDALICICKLVLINSKISPVCRDRGLSNQTKVFGFVVVFQAHAEYYISGLLRTCWNSALVYVLQDLLSRANDFYWRYDLAELHASSKARETTSTRGNY